MTARPACRSPAGRRQRPEILDIITRADAAASRRDADAYAAACLEQQAWRAYGQLQRQGSDPAETSCTEVSAR